MLASKSSSNNSPNTETRKGICSRILTPKQVGPICWFMATFVAMFYSQRSRKILLEASKGWNKKDELFKLLYEILHEKFMKVESRESEDYRKFSDDTFGNIVSLLHMKNPTSFPFDPKRAKPGFFGRFYIGKLYNLLNVDYKMFDYFHTTSINDPYYTLSYSLLNEDMNFYSYKIDDKIDKGEIGREIASKEAKYKTRRWKDDKIAPRILLISVVNYGQSVKYTIFPQRTESYEVQTYFQSGIISQGYKNIEDTEGYMKGNVDTEGYIEGNPNNLKSMRDTIYYNGYEYNLDSVLLSDWTIADHEIAGITCEKERYVYNGWVRTRNDPVMNEEVTLDIPCKLMEFNWNIKDNPDFCLNSKKCIPEVGITPHSLCFNFSKGNRVLVYVREEIEDKLKNLLKNKKDQKTKTSKITDIDYIGSIITKLLSMPHNIKKTTLLWLLTKRRVELRKEKNEKNKRINEEEHLRNKKEKDAIESQGDFYIKYVKEKKEEYRQKSRINKLETQRASLEKLRNDQINGKTREFLGEQYFTEEELDTKIQKELLQTQKTQKEINELKELQTQRALQKRWDDELETQKALKTHKASETPQKTFETPQKALKKHQTELQRQERALRLKRVAELETQKALKTPRELRFQRIVELQRQGTLLKNKEKPRSW